MLFHPDRYMDLRNMGVLRTCFLVQAVWAVSSGLEIAHPNKVPSLYTVQHLFAQQEPNILRNIGDLESVAVLQKGSGVHHAAALAFASPPVQHATPVAYPAGYPAPVKEEDSPLLPHFALPQTPVRHLAPSHPTAYHQFNAFSYPSLPQPSLPTLTHQPQVPGLGAQHNLLGVAYSSAPDVSHMTFANAYGVNYGY